MRMRETRHWMVVAMLVVATCAADVARAGNNNPNGAAFRSVGWVRGRSTVSAGVITCELPTITSAI